MSHPLPLLERVRIAAPCDVPWSSMTGDDRKRHCALCDLDVYDISAMTRDEAEVFLQERMGPGKRVCAGLFRRADGTIITKDCPVGLAAIRRRVRRMTAAVIGVVGAMIGYSYLNRDESKVAKLAETGLFRRAAQLTRPTTAVTAPPAIKPGSFVTLGYLCEDDDADSTSETTGE